MLARSIDAIEARLAPHAKAISIVMMVWFWGGIALQAGFIDFIDLPRAWERAIFWAGVAINAIWWGFLHPAIQRRRKLREGAEAEA